MELSELQAEKRIGKLKLGIFLLLVSIVRYLFLECIVIVN